MAKRPVGALLFLLLCAAVRAADDGPFQGPFVAAAPAIYLAVGDLNFDGLPDLCLGQMDGQLAVRLGLGDGAFAAPWLAPVADSALGHVELVDLDADGLLDVLVNENFNSGGPGDLHAFLGAGDGTFVPHGAWPGPVYPSGLRVADLQPDGAPDVLLTSRSAHITVVLLGDGHGGFVESGELPSSSWNADVADISGDGQPDVFIGSPGQTISILRGDGAGGFAQPVPILVGVPTEWVHVGDLSGDGRPDLLTGNAYGLQVLLGAGHLAFTSSQLLTNIPGDLSLVDVDEDGDLDVVAMSGSTAEIGLNDGTGTLDFQQSYFGSAGSGNVVAADATGDGDVDLIFTPGNIDIPYGTWMPLLRGRGDGSFTGNLQPMGWSPSLITTGDLNEDGNSDLPALGSGDEMLHVLIGSGQGNFVEAGVVAADDFPGQLQTVDTDGDGHLDVVHNSSKVWLHQGTGDGTLLAQAPMGTSELGAVRPADLQADGDTDFVGTDGNQNSVRSLINDGSAHFDDKLAFNQKGVMTGLCVADFGNDGWPDVALAIAYGSPSGLQLHPGLPNGGFGDSAKTAVDDGLLLLEAADIDANGDLDLAALDYTNHDLLWFRNDGSGNMALAGPGVPTASGYWMDLKLADVTRDGLVDALVWHADGPSVPFQEILCFAGLGGGQFAAPSHTVIDKADWLTPCDVNGDGALDLLSAGSCITMLMNRDGPWHDLGHALAGAHGKPKQVGTGTALPGTSVTVALHDAARLSPAVQFIGFGEGNVPFKGGVLVPTPDLVNHALETDAHGDLVIELLWPAGFVSGTSLVLQTWIRDDAAPALWSASNALRVTTPQGVPERR